MNASEATRLQAVIQSWVARTGDLRALALCGSWARGDARPDSDLDLLVLARQTAIASRANALASIPFADAGFNITGCRWVAYGIVHSVHINLGPIAEVELSFAPLAWASTTPVDAGTQRIVADAFAILVDKDKALAALIAAVSGSAPAAR